MAAYKVILKRSSILGKRPNNQLIEAGELALNTNAAEPGIFMEVSDGSIVKAGPTAYLPNAPTSTPARGELWVDSDTNKLSIGSANQTWESVAAPFLGGTNGYAVFVAPDFEQATDSLENDGQTLPFLTLNRAIIEVGKNIALAALKKQPTTSRYTIFIAPSAVSVFNGPGKTYGEFNIDFSRGSSQDRPTVEALEQFNHPDGGLIIPRGVSIVGMDLKKSVLRPTYIPTYQHPAFPANWKLDPNGPTYNDQPLTHVMRWSGNTYFSNFSVQDKISSRYVVSVDPGNPPVNGLDGQVAVFTTSVTHGLSLDDFVYISSESGTPSSSLFPSNAYYVKPISAFEFIVSRTSFTANKSITDQKPVLIADLPSTIISTPESNLYRVQNIYPYYKPPANEMYELSNYSAHRLSVFGNASKTALNTFYSKIQRAYRDLFGKTINTELTEASEFQIVSSTDGTYPNNLETNNVENASPYQNQIIHRSNYGMANCDIDGSIVSGFKSVIINSSTAVVLQRDPACFEVYTTPESNSTWRSITEYIADTLNREVTSVPTLNQLSFLNKTKVSDIRYYYKTKPVTDAKGATVGDSGVTNVDTDFRHYGFRARGANTFIQAQSTYTVGAAIGVWALDGAQIALTNATTNFGSIAFMAEGFAGITTLGGAEAPYRSFLHSGLIRPLALTESQVTSDAQKKVLSLGSRVLTVAQDPEDPEVQLVYLSAPFDPASILPYSLAPDSALYVDDGFCTYRGFFVTNGQPTVELNNGGTRAAILRIRASDSTIPNSLQYAFNLGIPYIRRFIDPRQATERAYGLYIESTDPGSRAPQSGFILRLNQTGQQLSDSIKRNYQFDPGSSGGVSQVFKVDVCKTGTYFAAGNYNNKVADANQSSTYAVYISLVDQGLPWFQTGPDELYKGTIKTPTGTYSTFNGKNYYAAENNSWSELYYETNYTPINGPYKVAPDKEESAFVPGAPLIRQQDVTTAFQGYVPDRYLKAYSTVPNPSYLRGATVPSGEVFTTNLYNQDDSSPSLGIIFRRIANGVKTVTVSDSLVEQAAVAPSVPPFKFTSTFGAPEVISLDLLTVTGIANPKQSLSVLELSYGNSVEYVRAVSLTSNTVKVLRDFYPEYRKGDKRKTWPKGTVVTVCSDSGFPEPNRYDPNWSVTLQAVARYYELMGYPIERLSPYLVPKYYGERIILNRDIPLIPDSGYAQTTTSWPVEFNLPSSILAHTHTWQSCGYIDYSRGLNKYRVNEFSRKLNADFLCSSSWGGFLSVSGSTENSESVQFGPVVEAMTGNYFNPETPNLNLNDKQLYQAPQEITFPNQISVYSADDISKLFDGERFVFPLTRGGFEIPPTQLKTLSVIVSLGAITQQPFVSYQVINNEVVFSDPPPKGSTCEIRVVTSNDDEGTLVSIPLEIDPNQTITGERSSFRLLVNRDYWGLNIDQDNTFIFIGGVLQVPGPDNAYILTSNKNDPSELDLSFTEPPSGELLRENFDIRAFTTARRYNDIGQYPVQVYSFDNIDSQFDGTLTEFQLRYNGRLVNPETVNAQNVLVSVGGAMQMPTLNPADPRAYTITGSTIVFSNPPAPFASCNIRLIANAEFIPCVNNNIITNVKFGLPICS